MRILYPRDGDCRQSPDRRNPDPTPEDVKGDPRQHLPLYWLRQDRGRDHAGRGNAQR